MLSHESPGDTPTTVMFRGNFNIILSSTLRAVTLNVYVRGLFVSMGVRGKPRMYYSLTGFLYRPLWAFQLWLPDAPAPIDAFRNLAAEVGTYGRGIRTGNLA
jgi:hypothetical protein